MRTQSNKTVLLADKFQRVTDKNNVGNTNVLTISAQHGLINQFEYYNHQYASENTSGYTLLHKGDFAYNKSYSDGYPWGATKRLERYDSGVVSPLYICFAAKDGVCADFYSYYFGSEPFYREIYKIAQEGARNHGLLNVATEDFFKIRIANPPLEEQRRIAEILGCCDRVIALKKELIAEKKKQKKALMQKLLNPDSGFRLPGFSGEWKNIVLEDICSFAGGGTPDTKREDFWNGTIPWISSADVEEKNFSVNPHRFITTEAIKFSATQLCPQESLLIVSRVGVGKIAIAQEPLCTSQDFTNLTKINGNVIFYAYLLKTILEAKARQTQGTSIKGITVAEIKHFQLAVPQSQKEQQAIADILSAADKEIDLLEQELAQQEQKKKSLMQLLLTGIVRV